MPKTILMYNARLFSKNLVNTIARRFIQRANFKPLTEKNTTHDLLWNVIERSKIQTPQDWKGVRNEILKDFRSVKPSSIDAVTLGICTAKNKYDLALSYLDFLKSEDIKLNLATLGKYFKLLYLKNVDEALGKQTEEQILSLYNNVRKAHPILDPITLESIIQALSLTKEWHLCVRLLDEMKVTSNPTSAAYSAVAAAAFWNGADDLAWKILNELLVNGRDIHDVVYTTYFKKIAQSSNKSKSFEEMFNFMQTNSLKVNPNSVENFVEALKGLKLIVYPSEIHARGLCKCCNNKLTPFEVSENEFTNLKTQIVKNVIVGKDVYNKTTEEELSKFKSFTSNLTKHDVIVDGLNVAYSAGVKQSPFVTSGLVASVVSHFTNQGKKVLLLGRKHMNKWPQKNWRFVLQNATVFLTENLSQDDPYLLYCALHSGKDTIIVTRDLMRGHKFLLKDVHLKCLFERWLAQRQYMLVRVPENGSPIFKKPLPFSLIAQKNGRYWHLPCKSSDAGATASSSWLCVKV